MATKPTNLLANLPNELNIKKVTQHGDYNEIFVEYEEYPRLCPECNSTNCVIKDSGREHRVYHTPYNNKTTHLIFHRRRFRCKDCNRSYMEQPEWLHPSLHITQPLYLNICLDLTDMLSISAIANKNAVTNEIVSSVLSLIQINAPHRLPEVLCMDEFHGQSGQWNSEKQSWEKNKFHASVIDGSSKAVIDILPKINASELKKYFRNFPIEERKQVRFYCCGRVDIPLTGYAPHRTGRAVFPHPAPCKADFSTVIVDVHVYLWFCQRILL